MQPVGMFELAWLGVPATITGLLYLIFIAPRLLRETKTLGASIPISREYLSEFRVLPVGRLASR